MSVCEIRNTKDPNEKYIYFGRFQYNLYRKANCKVSVTGVGLKVLDFGEGWRDESGGSRRPHTDTRMPAYSCLKRSVGRYVGTCFANMFRLFFSLE